MLLQNYNLCFHTIKMPSNIDNNKNKEEKLHLLILCVVWRTWKISTMYINIQSLCILLEFCWLWKIILFATTERFFIFINTFFVSFFHVETNFKFLHTKVKMLLQQNKTRLNFLIKVKLLKKIIIIIIFLILFLNQLLAKMSRNAV